MKSILIQILIFATNIIFNINIVHSRSAMNNDTLLLSSNTMNYEEAFIHIQNDSLFKHYINHYHLEKDNLITSDYYVWDNFLWNEIIDYKFPNINTAIKKSIYNLFTIVKSFYEPREIKDYPPLKDKEYSKSDLVLIFSLIKEDLFTAEVFFLNAKTEANELNEIYHNAMISIVYLFTIKESQVQKIISITSYR